MAEQKFSKDTNWGSANDFYGEDEITVTITLREYRELLKASFKFDKMDELERVRKDYVRVRGELDMAKARIVQLEEELCEQPDMEDCRAHEHP